MLRSWLLIGIVGSMIVHSFGFVADRSDNNVSKEAVAATWDTVPSLNTEQKGSFDSILNGKMQVTGMNKILQAIDSKKSVKHVVEGSSEELPREKRSGTVVVTMDSANPRMKIRDTIPLLKNASFRGTISARETVNTLQNVILLLIDEAGQDGDTLWKSLKTKHSFPIQGILQNCRNNLSSARYSLDEPLVSGRKDKDCDCGYFLRTNIASLLSWAQRAKEMTTGAVSVTNFSIPATLEYEGPIGISKEFEDLDENNVKPEVHHSKREFRDAWHLIDLDKDSGMTTVVTPATKQDPITGYDGMWDVFDMFSRIRIAFFRTLLDSLGGNLEGSEDEFVPRRPFPLQASLVELVGDTIKKLKSVSNNKGYMLVAIAPGNELPSALDLLEHTTSSKDTLLVVVGTCAQDKKPVPFYASGPGAKVLYKARTVWELPTAVKNAIMEGCRGIGCKNRHYETSALSPEAQVMSFSDENIPHKRVARGKNSSENVVSEDNSATNNKNATEPKEKSNASELTAEAVTTILGLGMSIVTTLALHS